MTQVSSETPRDRCAWIQHDFRVAHPGGGRPAQIGAGHVREVRLRPQHRHVGVVEIQERLQIREFVPRPQLIKICIRKLNPVALGQREDQFGFQGPFNVQVQFSQGHDRRCCMAVRFVGKWG